MTVSVMTAGILTRFEIAEECMVYEFTGRAFAISFIVISGYAGSTITS